MKGIYITLIFLSVVLVIMIGLAFFYLDQRRHQTFLYALYHGDALVGYEKVDKYLLENRQIYKSFTELSRDILHRKIVRKIGFDIRGKNLIDYKKEVSSNGANSTIYVLSGPEKISFMATGHADFSHLDKVPAYGNDLLFESRAIVTYPPLIRRYNFKKRGEQFVNVLVPFSTFLPPVREIVSITSIGRDVIEIESRKINCERLILELKNGDLISVWVTRRFHNILMVDMPKYGFNAVFRTEKKSIPVEEYKRKSDLYTEKEVMFTNEEIALHGTLLVPTVGEGPYPAVMLIWDSGPMDRNAGGIFTDLAHALAEGKYSVFKFDKRGIGQSQGFFSTYTQPEEISDLKCAIDFLKSLPEVDESRIALLGHSQGGFYAAYLAGSDKDVRACIIMSALSSLGPLENDCSKLKKFIKRVVPDDKEYLESAITATTQSREAIKEKGDWITVMDKRVFTKKMNLEGAYSVLDTIGKVKVPVLILHGRKDDANLAEEAKELGDALAKAGNDDFTITYFGKLNHFFGTAIKDSPIRDHIEVDMEVLKCITAWLDRSLLPLPAEPPVKPISTDKNMKIDESQETPKEESSEKFLLEVPKQRSSEASAFGAAEE